MASELLTHIHEARDFVRARSKSAARVGVILGTGLGDFTHGLEAEVTIPYRDIPHFPVSAVESHAGEMVLGRFSGKPVVLMRGRVHGYEGYSLREVSFPVRVLRALGVDTLILSNAVGGMNPNFQAGSLVLVTDHINLTGDNPLIGPNDDELGPRFPDMSRAYDPDLIRLAEGVAAELKIRTERGVFVSVMGPNLETAAEYRFLRAIGADVVGMSLIAENVAAIHGGQRVLAISVVTDMCLPDNLKPAHIPEILRVAGEAAPRLMAVVGGVIERM